MSSVLTNPKFPTFLLGVVSGVSVVLALNWITGQHVKGKRSGASRSTGKHRHRRRLADEVTITAASSASCLASDLLTPDSDEALSEIFHELDSKFIIHVDDLARIVRVFVKEMKRGLNAERQPLKMLPAFVSRLPTGSECDQVLAIDVGGSNFRVCLIELQGKGAARSKQRKYVISEELKTGQGAVLFDFFAQCIADFLKEYPTNKSLKLGFTFSFPCSQKSISSGTLTNWTKGFSAPGVVDQDVSELLQQALARKNLHSVHVTALVNDTVGTLLSGAYVNEQTYIGIILGTGSNAAYVERMDRIGKWEGPAAQDSLTPEYMVINMEWGNFDKEQECLPLTSYDVQVDQASMNPGNQLLEKLISGMYLGEIARYVMLDLIHRRLLFRGHLSPLLSKAYSFDTSNMSRFERDHSQSLSDIKIVLEDIFKIPHVSVTDCRIVKRICQLVGQRSARLAAMGIVGIVTHTNRLDGCNVAIDGSLYEHYPHYGSHIKDALLELLGIASEKITLSLARDGSGQGAALAAVLA
ncbi:hypothetical protein CXG81DRAFT_15715 [Caulochytrium protostelioides]|uniref:Phosphotransferase n=1 Tax=Caulochytrium protostelioides TaxID=1555241 RepID=A0A4P9WWJ9_9FUNG|nr:hypothetical protein CAUPRSCDRAFT_5980 [Caulochytrium protostelioides]RKO98595.1 hypothetical protein CXG81DRAFT_15715 [Caulochytrium protostelioides]|eukprot:RKO98595.1 hypothetical protein CXG81DRAFT_15715 [Caulochytrium protostelioides]